MKKIILALALAIGFQAATPVATADPHPAVLSLRQGQEVRSPL